MSEHLPSRLRGGRPADYETAVDPLSAAQTKRVIEMLIDTYYGGPQKAYAAFDRAVFHSHLSEVLDAAD